MKIVTNAADVAIAFACNSNKLNIVPFKQCMNDPTAALCDFNSMPENINIYSGFQRAIFAATCHKLSYV